MTKLESCSLIKFFNIAVVIFSAVQIINNERVKRDLENYNLQLSQPYKIRHILIDHFRAIYLEQHMKHWLEQNKNHFLNIREANVSITIPEAIQKFYTFFNDYKRDVRNYFEQQFIELPREEKALVRNELLYYVNNLTDTDRVKTRILHKCWEMETEIDHAAEDQIESIYDALDSVNVIVDVNFYNHLKKFEDRNNLDKKVVTPWQLGVFLHNLNEGICEHVEKEAQYNVAEAYSKKTQKRHAQIVDSIHKLNETYGAFHNLTTTTEGLATLV